MKLNDRRLERLVGLRQQLRAFVRLQIRNEQDAEDVTSEVLCVAWRRMNDIPDEPARASGWLYAVARNVSRNHIRGESRRRRRFDRAASQLEVDLRRSEATAVTEVLRRVEAQDAWSGLDESERQLLAWSAAGVDQHEMAAMLGVGVGAVRMRLLRARRRLADRLDEATA